jgi:hypothetical protein
MRSARLLGAATILLGLACSSAEVRPESPTRGSFETEARAFHLIFLRIPRRAFDHAMDRAGDLDLPEVRIESAVSYPDLVFPFSLLNRILGYSGATVKGRYGEWSR